MQIRWHPYQRILSPRTVVVVWLSLTATTNQAVAEATKSIDRPSPFERRASARIGVSVTVLPSCAINVSRAVGLDGQPVSVLCTKDTLYDISVSEGSRLSNGGLAPSAEQTLDAIIKQSTGQADLFTLKNAQVTKETLMSGDSEVTVLSIDF